MQLCFPLPLQLFIASLTVVFYNYTTSIFNSTALNMCIQPAIRVLLAASHPILIDQIYENDAFLMKSLVTPISTPFYCQIEYCIQKNNSVLAPLLLYFYTLFSTLSLISYYQPKSCCFAFLNNHRASASTCLMHFINIWYFAVVV